MLEPRARAWTSLAASMDHHPGHHVFDQPSSCWEQPALKADPQQSCNDSGDTQCESMKLVLFHGHRTALDCIRRANLTPMRRATDSQPRRSRVRGGEKGQDKSLTMKCYVLSLRSIRRGAAAGHTAGEQLSVAVP